MILMYVRELVRLLFVRQAYEIYVNKTRVCIMFYDGERSNPTTTRKYGIHITLATSLKIIWMTMSYVRSSKLC